MSISVSGTSISAPDTAASVLLEGSTPRPLDPSCPRPTAVGKFIRLAGTPWIVRGVSYGTFVPDRDRWQFPAASQVAADFAQMTRVGINTVRLYTPPPDTLLDEAARHGLRLMIGLPWAQHVAFLDDRALCRRIRRDLEAQMRRLGDHPAVLLFAIGNEVPAAVARWHGRERLERFLRDLYDVAKDASPESLQTYVNYPPTEYLELPFLDVVAFNVYLHRESELRAYLARLHHLAGNRPLLLAEAGADSLREGAAGQAALTAMQLRSAFREGACGAVAFTWTDEWWRGGREVEDWAFGLLDRNRRPKPALHATAQVFTGLDDARTHGAWPEVSVVVCAFNAADTLEECLTSLERLSYPSVEIIVVDDGSRDETAAIAKRHPVARLIEVEHGGLSVARNVGLAHATGDIVAYTDADVRVEPEWLTFLVEPMRSSRLAGSGGPNVVPDEDPWLAQCVARAPGGPSHVLFDDRVAEHVPGCNMAFRRDALLALGGFNPIFTKAGDDVDLCWRLQARGWMIGFAPCALVWHRHRSSIRAYWRQQLGYGESESWLKPLHPEKFAGRRAIWRGHIYSSLPFVRSLRHAKVNLGIWGSAPFPSVYQFAAHPLAHLPHSIRWQFASLVLLAVGMAALHWTPLQTAALAACLVGAGALGTTVAKCVKYALETEIDGLVRIGHLPEPLSRIAYRATVAWLHYVQPVARTYGRVLGFLSPARRPRVTGSRAGDPQPADSPGRDAQTRVRLLMGGRVEDRFWSERWVGGHALLEKMTDWLRSSRVADVIEIDDGWRPHRDISVAVGRWAWLDLRFLVEDHAGGRCLLRVATHARVTRAGGCIGGVAVGSALAVLTAGVVMGWSAATFSGLAMLVVPLSAAASRMLGMARVVYHAVATVTAEAGLVAVSSTEARPSWCARIKRMVARWRPDAATRVNEKTQ